MNILVVDDDREIVDNKVLECMVELEYISEAAGTENLEKQMSQ